MADTWNENQAIDDKTNPPPPGTSESQLDQTAGGVDYATRGLSGTTTAGKSDTAAGATSQNETPNRRWKNPLANYSSYTYQISLYMITPDAYEAFIVDGRRNLNAINNISDAGRESVNQANQPRDVAVVQSPGEQGRSGSPPSVSSSAGNIKTGGAFLIAQSGGINNSGPNQRAPGFDVDFYIDDLILTQGLNPKETQSSTNITGVEFKITEPYGFSFITRLKEAQDALKEICPTPGYTNISNPLKQFFILGIRFLGYDEKGNVIDPASVNNELGAEVGTGNGLYERYFDITINSIDFRMGGPPVVYTCTASVISGTVAFSLKTGMVWTGATVTGKTVYDALMGGVDIDPATVRQAKPSASGETAMSQAGAGGTAGAFGLLAYLNKEEKKRFDNKEIEIPAVWNIDFKGDSLERIGNATIVDPKNLDKRRVPTTSATSSKESNAATAQLNTQPNTNLINISLGKGISIAQAVDEIIKQSSYIEDSLNILLKYNDDNTVTGDGSAEIINNKSKVVRGISWYNLSAEVVVIGWDKLQQDFIFKTTFIIQPYETPVTLSAYADKTTPYPGPHKRYEYWWTGKNSEIMRFEQSYKNTFFNVAINGAGVSDTASGGKLNHPVRRGIPTGQPIQGQPNYNMEAQNSYISDLYDPGSWAEVNFTILGDPDFLMQPAASSIATLYNKYYGTDGYSINPHSGQIFVEINFKEPDDYNHGKGTLDINSSINIYPHPPYIQDEINKRGGGVAMLVYKVVSKFSRGLFQQDISGAPGIFQDNRGKETSAARTENQTDAETNRLAGKAPIVSTTNSGTGAAATTSAAKVAQTKVKTGTSPIALNGLSYDKNASLMSAYKSRAQSGTAPTPAANATTVKSMATAEAIDRGTNAVVNKGKLNPWDHPPVPPAAKPVEDQTKLNKQGVADGDAGYIMDRGTKGKFKNPWDRRD